MAPRAGTEEGYAIQMGELWSALTRTLTRLDELAAEPERLDAEEAHDALRRLQYGLHARRASTSTGSRRRPARRRLTVSFGRRSRGRATRRPRSPTRSRRTGRTRSACSSTSGAEHSSACGSRGCGSSDLVRPRSSKTRAPAAVGGAACSARCSSLCGACVFVLGATAGHWPIWAAGMLAVCGSTLDYRP